MKQFHILHANLRSNPSAEALISSILKSINIEAIFHKELTYSEGKNNEKYLFKYDMIYFDGGEDVNPSLYNQHAHPLTSFNKDRDSLEQLNFKKVKKCFPNIPCFGICRG